MRKICSWLIFWLIVIVVIPLALVLPFRMVHLGGDKHFVEWWII